MIRKLLDRLNPTRQLPDPMRRYLALPRRLFLAWMLLSALLVAGPSLLVRAGILSPEIPVEEEPAAVAEEFSQPPSEAASAESDLPSAPDTAAPVALALAGNLDAQLTEAGEIAVTGPAPFSLKRSGDKVLLRGPNLAALQLAGDAERLEVQTLEGATVYRLKVKEADQGKIYDAAGQFLFRLKCETEDGEAACKLYDAAGNKLNRVKLKADSFNVYGAGSERLYKGKLKNGAWQVKDEAGNTVLAIRGAGSLREAALLAMPVDPAVRMLMWRHAGVEP